MIVLWLVLGVVLVLVVFVVSLAVTVDCAADPVVDVAVVMAPVNRDFSPENDTEESDEKDGDDEVLLLPLVVAGVVKVDSAAGGCCTTPLPFVGNGYDPVGIAKVLSRSRKTFFHTNGSIAIQYHCRDTYVEYENKNKAKVQKVRTGSIVTPLFTRPKKVGVVVVAEFGMYLLACSDILNVEVAENLVCNLDGQARDNVHGGVC